tara:strand:+ start:2039 stop:2317 length:279 start_codon:yes stop_codon:yes gene_type:complete
MISLEESAPYPEDESYPYVAESLLVCENLVVDMREVVAVLSDGLLTAGGGHIPADQETLYLAKDWMLRQAEERLDAKRSEGCGECEQGGEFI